MQKQSGFTLVELSIVLVIIGLLIGGILIGQSLVSSVRNNAQVKQMQQLDIALSNFRVKFKDLPGDTVKFPNPGDNDGKIEWTGTSSVNFTGETRYFYSHLQQGGFTHNNWDFTNPSTCGNAGTQCDYTPPVMDIMPAEINDQTGIMVGYDPSVGGYMGRDTNEYQFTKFDTGSYRFSANSILCIDIFGFDKKIDDGKPNTGKVLSGGCTDTANASAIYLESYFNLLGRISMRVGSTTSEGASATTD